MRRAALALSIVIMAMFAQISAVPRARQLGPTSTASRSAPIDGQTIVDAIENALTRYPTANLFEVTDTRVADGSKRFSSLTWSSGSCLTCYLRDYLYGSVTGSNLASRL